MPGTPPDDGSSPLVTAELAGRLVAAERRCIGD